MVAVVNHLSGHTDVDALADAMGCNDASGRRVLSVSLALCQYLIIDAFRERLYALILCFRCKPILVGLCVFSFIHVHINFIADSCSSSLFDVFKKWLWSVAPTQNLYLPMQKWLNMFCRTSSVVTWPAMSLRWKMHSRMSWAMKSPESCICRPCSTRWMASRAWVRAS